MNDGGAQRSRRGNRAHPPYRLLGICGSLRAAAFSRSVLRAFAHATASRASYEFSDIGALPHFNQDHFQEPLPPVVQAFRDQITRSDGLVIVSPEYNHGIPGVLKNALDWASRPHNNSPLKGKPVLVATCSAAFTGGVRAQHQIRETLVSTLARPVAVPEIVIGGVATNIIEGNFQDGATIQFALTAFDTLFDEIAMRVRLSSAERP